MTINIIRVDEINLKPLIITININILIYYYSSMVVEQMVFNKCIYKVNFLRSLPPCVIRLTKKTIWYLSFCLYVSPSAGNFSWQPKVRREPYLYLTYVLCSFLYIFRSQVHQN